MRLFALYRQAEMHRKALIVQKRYLQCQVDAFFQTQQSALLMMADMGAPINLDSHPTQSKYPPAYARFKAVGCVVIATLRFRYILKRKMHHLRSQINKLQKHSQKSSPLYDRGVTSTSNAPVPTSSEENLSHRTSSTAVRQPSPIGLSTGIQTVLSGYPATVSQPLTSRVSSQTGSVPLSSLQSYPSLLSTSPQQIPSQKPDTSHSELHFTRHISHSSTRDFSHPPPTIKPLQQRQETRPPQVHGTKMSKPPKASPSLSTSKNGYSSGHKLKSPSSTTKSPAKSDVDTSQDPQLTAYIKGLERLKARLSKTSM
jgi:hypothetical protein